MEKEIFEILTKVQNGEQSIGEAKNQLLLLFNVSGLLFLELAIRCQRELPATSVYYRSAGSFG